MTYNKVRMVDGVCDGDRDVCILLRASVGPVLCAFHLWIEGRGRGREEEEEEEEKTEKRVEKEKGGIRKRRGEKRK